MKSSPEQGSALHLPKRNKPWLEGWYVHVQTKEISFAVIFGLQISNAKKSVFIQFSDTHTKKSRYMKHPWKAVTTQQYPFVLSIRGNRLSTNSVTLRLSQLQAGLLHSSLTPLYTSSYASTIMDPLSYVSMERVHPIISSRHTVSGTIRLNDRHFQIRSSDCMEKNHSTSFSSAYAWFQSNNCEDTASCFFFFLAHISFPTGSFQGCTCMLVVCEKRLYFAIYLGCHVTRDRRSQQIVLKRYPLELHMRPSGERGHAPASPKQGAMWGRIQETLRGEAFVILLDKGRRIRS